MKLSFHRTRNMLLILLLSALLCPLKSQEVLFNESFDDADLTKNGWYDESQIIIVGNSRAGKGCIEYAWDHELKRSGSASIRHLFEPSGEIYIRFYLKLSKNWGWTGRNYHPHLTHFMTTENSDYHGPAASHLTLYIEPVNGKLRLAATDIQNKDMPHGLTQGELKGGYNGKLFDSDEVLFKDDRWHCIEAYFRLNTLDMENDRPYPDGIVRGWFDNELVIDHSDVILRSTDFPEMRINQFLMAPYFGPGLLPHAQKLWIDELTVGTKRTDTLSSCNIENPADMIITNGKILTVDSNFTIAEAMAIKDDKIIAVGTNREIIKLADRESRIIDAAGRTIIPGIIDAHLHPEMASLSEMEEPIPDVHSIAELLDWIRSETEIKPEGEWIVFPKMFFTRLTELRQPSLSELDSVAPLHPVFLNGSFGGMINSAAMQASGIDKNTDHPGILEDQRTGKLTGFIRASSFHLLKLPPPRSLSSQEREDALLSMLSRYNRYGITSLCSGAGDFDLYSRYRELAREGKLTMRICQNILLDLDSKTNAGMLVDTLKSFHFVSGYGDEWARIGALKVFLDGGILTGTAYLREPWGDKAGSIFGIRDTTYRGVVNFTHEELFAIVAAANENNWKFTAHCTGGGAVDLLLDVYEQVDAVKSIKDRRFSVIHGNFFTDRAIQRMSKLGVYADLQPAWFFKDADAMTKILGEERIETFHPYRSLLDAGVIVNGGSDHMVKWDADASINPYNPFLAMWSAVTRTTERNTIIMPSEAITREEALRMYTINNAYASFEESIKGSIEPGKLADVVILSEDFLDCPVNRIRDIRAEMTVVGGKIVYSSEE